MTIQALLKELSKEGEIWKRINSKYQVSNYGRVFRMRGSNKGFIKPKKITSKNVFYQLELSELIPNDATGKFTGYRLAELMMLAFKPNEYNKHFDYYFEPGKPYHLENVMVKQPDTVTLNELV